MFFLDFRSVIGITDRDEVYKSINNKYPRLSFAFLLILRS